MLYGDATDAVEAANDAGHAIEAGRDAGDAADAVEAANDAGHAVEAGGDAGDALDAIKAANHWQANVCVCFHFE